MGGGPLTRSLPGRPSRPRLPDFPWDSLAGAGARRRAPGRDRRPVRRHAGRPGAAADSSALAGRSEAPGYPTVHGTPAVRGAYAGWLGGPTE